MSKNRAAQSLAQKRWANEDRSNPRVGHAGGRKPIPTACPRCREEQPSVCAARAHCRNRR